MARDHAKLGRLYLQKGWFRGEQVIPREWVSRAIDSGFATAQVLDTHHKMMGVWNDSYRWWLVSREHRDFMAVGHGGQFLYMRQTLIVSSGGSRANSTSGTGYSCSRPWRRYPTGRADRERCSGWRNDLPVDWKLYPLVTKGTPG